jgi:hypothetical protein
MAAAFLANFLFWSGLAIGGIVFAALVQITGGEWLGAMRITAGQFRRFLPVSLALFLLLMWQSADLYPWAQSGSSGLWSRRTFVMLRDTVAILAVYGSALAYCGVSRQAGTDWQAARSTGLAIVLVLVYAFGFSLLAADLIMSLEPQWNSTLFPAYVFTGNVYGGAAAIAAVAVWRTDPPVPRSRVRDLANVLVGLSLLWVYLFWSQFLVVWYGNVTTEVAFVMSRIGVSRPTGWIVLAVSCAIPATVLIPQRGKQVAALRLVTPLILSGLMIERWLLVAPPLPPTTAAEAIGITVAFGLAFVACVGSGTSERSGESGGSGKSDSS